MNRSSAECLDEAFGWLRETPKTWQLRPLKSLGQLIAGSAFPEAYQGVLDAELPFYKVKNLGSSTDGRHLASTENTISRQTAEALRTRVVPVNAIVYAKIGAALLLNRRRITTVDACIDNNMTAFVPDPRVLTTEWAYYILSSLDFGVFVNPGAVPSLSEGDQSDLVLPVPSIRDQERIVVHLDSETARIDKLITMQESLIERLDEYRTALITRVVTKGLPPEGGVAKSIRPDPWRDLRLKNLVRFSPGRFIEPREMNEAGPVPVYGANGIRGYTGTPTHEGPALVTGRVGTCGTISMEAGPLWATNNAIVMHPTDRCDLRWLRYAVEEMDLGRYTASTAQPALHMDTVRNLRMKVPPRTTQTKMADYLDHNTASIGALQEKATELIDRSLEFRNALVTAAVTGKINLTPRARKAEPPLGLSTSQ